MCFIRKEKKSIRTGFGSLFLNCWTSYQENPCIACSNCYFVFFIQTACGIVFFIKQLVCVLLENKKNQYEQVLALVSELLDLLSRKPLHRLFRLFFCLFLFKLPVLYHSSLNYWWVLIPLPPPPTSWTTWFDSIVNHTLVVSL